jgi:hypothetical protein
MRNVHFLLALGLTLLSAGVFARCIGYSVPEGLCYIWRGYGFNTGPGAYTGLGNCAYAGSRAHIDFTAPENGKVPPLGLGATYVKNAA